MSARPRERSTALRALAAVDEDALAAPADQRRRGDAGGGGHGTGRAEEDDVEIHPAESSLRSAEVSRRRMKERRGRR